MGSMAHKGYRGVAEYSPEDRIFHGHVHGIRDVVTFEGTSVEELEQAFRDSVDDYLEFCRESGKQPDRSYSGRIPLRIGEDLHRRVDLCARSEGSSLNAWIASKLEWLAAENARRRRA